MAIIDVIEYEGNSDVLVYKYPHSDFSTMSQLIVRESQEAILYKDGKMLDSFLPGKYTLHTGNIPLLSKVVNLPFGGNSPFKCDVFFVNKTIALDYKWGTKTQTKVMDMHYHLMLDIGASGVVGIKVRNPYDLMLKIVGTQSELRAETCLSYFRENISAKVKEYLGKVMRKPEMDFLILETCLSDFSEAVKNQLNQLFLDIGVELYNFVIGAIQIPQEQYVVIQQGQYDIQRALYSSKIKKIEAQGDAEAQVIRSQGKAQSRKVEGYNWADEQIAEITKIYASNSQMSENPANMLAQAPMVMAFGNMMRENMEPVLENSFSNPGLNFHSMPGMQEQRKEQGFSMPDMGFDGFGAEDISPLEDEFSPVNPGESAKPVQAPHEDETMEDFEKRMKKLKIMLDTGIITQEEFEKKKMQIMDNILKE